MENIRLDIYSFNNEFTCYRIDEVDSTNSFFKRNYSNFESKDVLIARHQTSGRGRYNRVWQSQEDVIFSILFKEEYKNQIIAPLAVCLALNKLKINAGIKWPNDIYVNDKKICGILIEDIYDTKFRAAIVGIGINMSSKDEVCGIGIGDFINCSVDKVINEVLLKYQDLLHFDNHKLIELYHDYSIILGKNIIYKGKVFKAVDITEDGYLKLSDGFDNFIINSDEIDIKSSLVK